jgi:hypothetical protein
VTDTSALATAPVQLAWLGVPFLLLVVAVVRGSGGLVLALGVGALAALAYALNDIQNTSGEGISSIAGMPMGMAASGVLALAATALAVRSRAPLAIVASGLWLLLVTYWLV